MDSQEHEQLPRPSILATLAYGMLIFYGLHLFLDRVLGIATLSPTELLWNSLVSISPSYLVLDSAQRRELLNNPSRSQTFAAKSAALRTMLGLGEQSALLQRLPAATESLGTEISNMVRRKSTVSAPVVTSHVPSGLGNWDNSCYQNSVLQALSSLSSLRQWLKRSSSRSSSQEASTTSALQGLVLQLMDPSRNGKHIWTPAKLKNMSSWQQQDAQEYFSKIMDELDKDAETATRAEEYRRGLNRCGLEAIDQKGWNHEREIIGQKSAETNMPISNKNPLQGWNAQRVTCIQCGYSEGYSMIPFYCLTVPLGSSLAYNIQDCLDAYTKREAIDGVECRRCTLLQAEAKLRKMCTAPVPSALPEPNTDISLHDALALPPEIRVQIANRLAAIQKAIDQDDYSDKTLKQDCQIAANAYVSSTKTREAVIGRAPQSLVIHVNRSMFNELTGMQSKNYAHVRYPSVLNLRPWMLHTGDSSEYYRLSSVVTHKGAHENGHYICYKQHPLLSTGTEALERSRRGSEEDPWYMLSDSDVYDVDEDEVLAPRTGGVFMLFYERITGNALERELFAESLSVAVSIPLPADAPDELDDSQAILTPLVNEPGHNLAQCADEELTEGSEPPTVPPSELSEPDTDITDYEQPDLSSQKESHALTPPVEVQPIFSTAVPKDAMMESSLRSGLRAMRV